MNNFISAVRRTLVDLGEVFQEAAHDATYDLRDNALRGFGVPKLVSSVASFSVAAVAAAGTASVSMDLFSKIYGKKECRTCNGWEGLRCTMCGGSGKVQYTVPGLLDNGKVSVETLASAVVDSQTEVTHFPSSFDTGLPLPWKECQTCDGTGVMKCTECKGVSWKCKFSFDDIMNVPWKTWDVYQKTQPPVEHIYSNMEDPATAAVWMFGRSELEDGIKYDDDVKQKMMSEYQDSRRYDVIREIVAKRKPGWEELQKTLYTINPARAMVDPVVIKNVPYYKARKQIEAEVARLEVPPRPAEWADKYERPLKQSYWTDEELKDPAKMSEMETLLRAQEFLVKRVLDTAWEMKWRQQKVEEVVQERIQPYMEALKKSSVLPKESKEGTPAAAKMSPQSAETVREAAQPRQQTKEPKGKAAPAPQKKADKKASVEDKKKERQERAERLAKQAAEREAALAKAKAGSGKVA